MSDYIPIPPIPTNVTFSGPGIPYLVALHYWAGGQTNDLLAPTGSAGDPARATVDDAATTIGDHAVLNGWTGDAWVAAAGDQNNLSVDDQLAPDGTITGHIASGEDQTARSQPTGPWTGVGGDGGGDDGPPRL